MSDYKDRVLSALMETLDERDAAPGRPPAVPPRRPARRHRLGIAAACCAAIAVAGLVLALPRGGGGVDVIARAAAAITPEPDTILHYRIDGVRIYSPYAELWQTPGPPTRVRARGQGATGNNEPCIFEYSSVIDESGSSEYGSTWDAATQTVYTHPQRTLAPGSFVYPDPFASVREHLAAGALREAGRETVNGRPAILLEPRERAGLPVDGRFGDLTRRFAYYVDAETYRPLRWVIDRGVGQYYDVTTFEYLPADAANTALLSVEGAHPDAPVTNRPPPITASTCGAG